MFEFFRCQVLLPPQKFSGVFVVSLFRYEASFSSFWYTELLPVSGNGGQTQDYLEA